VAVGITNLTIWDEIELGGVKYVGESVIFYANYTNSTSGVYIIGVCNISFDDGSNGTMDYNPVTEIYNYSKSFSTSGNHTWNVTCYNSTYGGVNANDTVYISSIPTQLPQDFPKGAPVPGLSDIGLLILCILALILGVRKIN